MKYISLFSSAGIGTFGLHLDGHQCIATNELLSNRMDFQILNNIAINKDSYILGDITLQETKNKIYSQNKKYGGADIIIATPPCQGISLLNLKKNENDKFRNSLVIESLEIIKKIKPKIFILENVLKFLSTACFHEKKWKKIKDAILEELEEFYSISFKTLNLKHIGSKSSRTRTIVIGLRRDISKHYSPWELMPSKVKSIPTLHEVIGDLLNLSWGEFYNKDFYHAFRIYDKRMETWISCIEPGQSAFDNTKIELKPHKIIDGKIILNKNSAGDKYKRQFPDKVGPCIMTRNDQLASQNTVHPFNNRVFSIRELMLLMTIPNEFKFFNLDNKEFLKLDKDNQKKYYRKKELSIRRTIGESVPTFLFKKIIRNFVEEERKQKLNSKNEINNFILQNNINKTSDLLNFTNKVSRISLNLLFEELEKNQIETGLYFTNPDIVTDLINSIQFKGTSIIEPSVGLGSFLLPLLKAFPEKKINFSAYDINANALKILKKMIKGTKVVFFNRDFLSHDNISADLIIGNPPYVQIKKGHKYIINSEAKNLFELFVYKSKEISKEVIFVLPKYVLFNHKYSDFRNYMLNNGIYRFWDYKGMLFPNAKIETIVVGLNNKKNKNFICNNSEYKIKKLTNDNSSVWTIHPNNKLIKYGISLRNIPDIKSIRMLKFNPGMAKKQGTIPVLTSFFLRTNNIQFFVSKNNFNHEQDLSGILVPNMTKNIRAILKPNKTIWNGSLALVLIKEELYEKAIETWNSEIFKEYINMLRSGAERSINIDKEIIKHFGVKE